VNARAMLCTALAAFLGATALASAETVAIVGGTVYPVSGPRIQNGTVVIDNGRIRAVGANVAIPAGARRIDARGKIVTPGFINAKTTIGLTEVGGERATRNGSARGVVNADFEAWESFFSESAMIASNREDGITSVGIMPSGSFVAGQAAVMDLCDGTASEMLRRPAAGLVATLQTTGRFNSDVDEMTAGADTAGPADATAPPLGRAEAIGALRELLDDARVYAAHRAAYDDGRLRALAASRRSLAALVRVAQGREPLILTADRVDDIEAAIRLAREEHIRVIVDSGAEAWMIAPKLAAAHIAVITGAMNNIPTTFDTLNQRQENAALLRRAGVDVILVGNAGGGDEEGFNARNVKFEAGNAVAYGMSHDDALRAVTLAPAAALGVADRVGTLAPGKDANVVVWSGDPFEFSTTVEHVFVRGREYQDRSRQDLLTERYRRLPPARN
jgi:imidazolonepropionase-like amidohydrolase